MQKNGLFNIKTTLLFVSICCLMACSQNKLDVDVSDIQVEVTIKRFEKDLFGIPPQELKKQLPALEKKYPRFFELYTQYILPIGKTTPDELPVELHKYITYPTTRETYEKVMEKYPDLDSLHTQLVEALKHYRYYYPDSTLPEFVTFISSFNYSVVTDKDLIGIGLDNYLGVNCEFYAHIPIQQYLRYKMHRKKIVSDCMYAFSKLKTEYNDSVDNLLNRMIYEGRALYFTKAMIPNEHDSLITGYSQFELEWCKAHEQAMWEYLIEQKLLYTSETLEIKRYLNDAPFTSTFTKESPGKTGVWIGLQIVKEFVDNNPEITLPKLMQIRDYQKILTLSQYNP